MGLLPIVNRIKQGKVFYIVSHVLPDGDSIGSMLALGEALESIDKEVHIFCQDPVPRKYAFLKGIDKIRDTGMLLKGQETILALDCSDLDRLGVFKDTVSRAKFIINIDHHVTNHNYGTLNLIDSGAAATGEIIFKLIQELKAPLTGSIADALYVAISTDTGSFKYENTTPGTHRLAAHLLESGVKPGALSQQIFDERPLSFYLLLKDALATLELHSGDKIAVMTVSYDMLERFGTSVDDLEGLVNYTRNIEGVEMGILFFLEKEDDIKVGLRSRGVDVSRLAGQFNGGGHARAAGCRMKGEFSEVKDAVLKAARELLLEHKAGGDAVGRYIERK